MSGYQYRPARITIHGATCTGHRCLIWRRDYKDGFKDWVVSCLCPDCAGFAKAERRWYGAQVQAALHLVATGKWEW